MVFYIGMATIIIMEKSRMKNNALLENEWQIFVNNEKMIFTLKNQWLVLYFQNHNRENDVIMKRIKSTKLNNENAENAGGKS